MTVADVPSGTATERTKFPSDFFHSTETVPCGVGISALTHESAEGGHGRTSNFLKPGSTGLTPATYAYAQAAKSPNITWFRENPVSQSSHNVELPALLHCAIEGFDFCRSIFNARSVFPHSESARKTCLDPTKPKSIWSRPVDAPQHPQTVGKDSTPPA